MSSRKITFPSFQPLDGKTQEPPSEGILKKITDNCVRQMQDDIDADIYRRIGLNICKICGRWSEAGQHATSDECEVAAVMES